MIHGMKQSVFLLVLIAIFSAGTLSAGDPFRGLLKANEDPKLSYTQKLKNFQDARTLAQADSEKLKQCWINRFFFTREELWGNLIPEMLAEKDLKEEHRAEVFLAIFRTRTFAGDHSRILNFFHDRMSRTDGMGKVRYAVLIATILDEFYRINGVPSARDCLNMVRILESARTPAVADDPELNWYLAKAHLKLGNLPSANDALQIVLKKKPPFVEMYAVHELNGDLLRAGKDYAGAYRLYGEANRAAGRNLARICWKQAECAMMEQQYKHALGALEQIPQNELDPDEKILLRDQIRNLKSRL